MSRIRSPRSLKSLREALCLAEGAANRVDTDQYRRGALVIGDLIRDIDRQRPLGSDGKHRDRHTLRCGCAWSQRFRAWTRAIRHAGTGEAS